MVAKDPLSLSKGNRKGKELQKLKKRLEHFADQPTNRVCADCPEGDPLWACFLIKAAAENGGAVQAPADPEQTRQTNQQLAVLCCYDCYKYHCTLGEAVSLPKNITATDTWSEIEVNTLVSSGGNVRVNKILEAKLSPTVYNKSFVLEDPVADAAARQQFIRHKYEDLSYLDVHLYKMHMQAVANMPIRKAKNAIKRSRTHDGSSMHKPMNLRSQQELLNMRKPNKKAESVRHFNGNESCSSDEETFLPMHLGVKHRGSSTTNLALQGQNARRLSNKGQGIKASSNTRRGRRRSQGEIEKKKIKGSGIRSSASTPSLSRWNTSPGATGVPPAPTAEKKSKNSRWNSSPDPSGSKKNFSWGGDKSSGKGGDTGKEGSLTDIAALRDICVPKLSLKVPQRVESDESGLDDSLRMPQRMASDDDLSGRSQDRSTPLPLLPTPRANSSSPNNLRMPRRIVSDDSGSESGRVIPSVGGRGHRSNSLFADPTSAQAQAARALLTSRRSMPTLGAKTALEYDEDSIRNPYGGGVQGGGLNSTFPVRRQRTCFNKPKPKYGIKLKYGYDSKTDTTDSERDKRTKPRIPMDRVNTGAAAEILKSAVVPTLGVFLQKNQEPPSRILGGRSLASASCSDDDVMGIGPGKKGIASSKAGGKAAKQARQSLAQAARLHKKSALQNYLHTKMVSGASPAKSSKRGSLPSLSELGGMSVASGFSFSNDTEDELSFVNVKPKSVNMRRGTSCGGLRALPTFDPRDDSSIMSNFSRSSRGNNNAVW